MLGGNELDAAFIALVALAATMSLGLLGVNIRAPLESVLLKVSLLLVVSFDGLLTVVAYAAKSPLTTVGCFVLTTVTALTGTAVSVNEPRAKSRATALAVVGSLVMPISNRVDSMTSRIGIARMTVLSLFVGLAIMVILLLDAVGPVLIPVFEVTVSVDVFSGIGQESLRILSPIASLLLTTVLILLYHSMEKQAKLQREVEKQMRLQHEKWERIDTQIDEEWDS